MREHQTLISTKIRGLCRAFSLSSTGSELIFKNLIESGSWPQFDPTQTVLLDDVPEVDDIIVDLANHPSASSSVRIRHYENTRVIIELECGAARFRGAERCLALVVDCRSRWHRYTDFSCEMFCSERYLCRPVNTRSRSNSNLSQAHLPR